jgi:hypothetical protein
VVAGAAIVIVTAVAVDALDPVGAIYAVEATARLAVNFAVAALGMFG